MSSFTEVILKAGLITQQQLEELKAFRVPSIPPDAEVAPPVSLQEAAQAIEQVLQSEGMVLVRETDLESVQQYIQHAEHGILHIDATDVKDPVGTLNETDIQIMYSLTTLKEYLIPWRSESLADLLINGASYLINAQGQQVHFRQVRELFFGEQKAFMVCTAARALSEEKILGAASSI
jgi:hypothetical protein